MNAMKWNQNEMTGPVWFGDFGSREHLLPGPIKLDAAAFAAVAGVAIATTALAASGATAVTVAALSGPIPSGTVLLLGGKTATTSANVAASATSIPVLALNEAIPSGSTGTYNGSLTSRKLVRAGTLIGRTFAERAANGAFGPAADADDETYFLAFDVLDLDKNPMGTVVRGGTLIKENFVPGFAGLSTALKAKVRAFYQTTIGAP